MGQSVGNYPCYVNGKFRFTSLWILYPNFLEFGDSRHFSRDRQSRHQLKGISREIQLSPICHNIRCLVSLGYAYMPEARIRDEIFAFLRQLSKGPSVQALEINRHGDASSLPQIVSAGLPQ